MAKSEQNGTLDAARLLAAAGIVVFHTGAPGAALGYAGLPFFLVLLVLLMPVSAEQGFNRFARHRFKRLILPWLGWSLVYGGLKLAEAFALQRPIEQSFAPWMLLTGPALHLWFLPFAFVASLALWPLTTKGHARAAWPAAGTTARTTAWTTAGIAAGIVLLLAIPLLPMILPLQPMPIPVPQWLFALPPLLLGLVLLALPANMHWAFMALYAGLGLALDWPGGMLQTAIGGGLVLACLALPCPANRWTDCAARLSLPLYLAHPLIISLLHRTAGLSDSPLLMALLAILLTLALSLALHRLDLRAAPLLGWAIRRFSTRPNPA